MIELPDLSSIPEAEQEAMCEAAVLVVETAEALAARGANAVSEAMKGTEEFREWDHYPKGDIRDLGTFAQYYYHSHNGAADEHGHFHTFIRAGGIGDEFVPVTHAGSDAKDWPSGKETIAHFIAISMDHHGLPTHLFTTNRWVTGETVFSAGDMAKLLPRFRMDDSEGEWAEPNRWITSMMTLFRPQITQLLIERDAAIEARREQTASSGTDVYEDRGVEITSICEISIMDQLEWLEMLD